MSQGETIVGSVVIVSKAEVKKGCEWTRSVRAQLHPQPQRGDHSVFNDLGYPYHRPLTSFFYDVQGGQQPRCPADTSSLH